MLKALISSIPIKKLTVSERMKIYEASFEYEANIAPGYSFFSDIVRLVEYRDDIKIYITDDCENQLIIPSGPDDEEKYKSFMRDVLSGDVIQVKIKINKVVKNNRFSIYSYENFCSDIKSLSLHDVLLAFSELLSGIKGNLYLDIFEKNIPTFATTTMCFATKGSAGSYKELVLASN